MKKCYKCKTEKDEGDFHKSAKRYDGLSARCKPCTISYVGTKYTVPKLRKQIMERLGTSCAKCGFDDIRALQIDHINGGGKREILSFNGNTRNYYKSLVKKDLSDYQILCANCNWIKRYENNECANDR